MQVVCCKDSWQTILKNNFGQKIFNLNEPGATLLQYVKQAPQYWHSDVCLTLGKYRTIICLETILFLFFSFFKFMIKESKTLRIYTKTMQKSIRQNGNEYVCIKTKYICIFEIKSEVYIVQCRNKTGKKSYYSD